MSAIVLFIKIFIYCSMISGYIGKTWYNSNITDMEQEQVDSRKMDDLGRLSF